VNNTVLGFSLKQNLRGRTLCELCGQKQKIDTELFLQH